MIPLRGHTGSDRGFDQGVAPGGAVYTPCHHTRFRWTNHTRPTNPSEPQPGGWFLSYITLASPQEGGYSRGRVTVVRPSSPHPCPLSSIRRVSVRVAPVTAAVALSAIAQRKEDNKKQWYARQGKRSQMQSAPHLGVTAKTTRSRRIPKAKNRKRTSHQKASASRSRAAK